MAQFVGLQAANTVLGTDGAIEGFDLVKNPSVDFIFMVLKESGAVCASGRLNVVVQIAIAQMTKVDQSDARYFGLQQGIGFDHKLRDA